MKRFKDIIFVVEPETACKPALERAVALTENNQANLTVVDVVERVSAGSAMPEGFPNASELQAAVVKRHSQGLESLVGPYLGRIKIETQVLVGTSYLEIIREVLRNERDLVIKVAQHQNWLDRLFGSDDMNLLRKCPCPVWLVKPRESRAHRRILAAVDVNGHYPQREMGTRHALNLQVLEIASSLALAESADLHIVAVWEAIGESFMRGGFQNRPEEEVVAYVEEVRRQHVANLDALVREFGASKGQDALDYLKSQNHLLKGLARKEIPMLARTIDADLIVMGTVARIGVPGFVMGNTAETILQQIDCSVLAVKPEGFLTPVTLDD